MKKSGARIMWSGIMAVKRALKNKPVFSLRSGNSNHGRKTRNIDGRGGEQKTGACERGYVAHAGFKRAARTFGQKTGGISARSGSAFAFRALASSAYSRSDPRGVGRRSDCYGGRLSRSGKRLVRSATLAEIKLFARSRGRLRSPRADRQISPAAWSKVWGNSTAPGASREISHPRTDHDDRRPAGRAMDGASGFRQVDAAVSARPDHAGKSKDKFH